MLWALHEYVMALCWSNGHCHDCAQCDSFYIENLQDTGEFTLRSARFLLQSFLKHKKSNMATNSINFKYTHLDEIIAEIDRESQ